MGKKKIKVIVTIHDIMFYTQQYPIFSKQAIGAFYRRIGAKIATNRADIIHTFTNYTKNLINMFLGVEKNKIIVIPQGSPNDLKEFDDSIFTKLGIRPGEYLYTITGISPNKNFSFLLKIYEHYVSAAKNPLTLVVSGVDKQDNHNGIIFTEYLSEGEKNSLLKNARAFLFLSRDEGFGLPPLEAIMAGTRVILTDIPIFRELYDGIAYFVSSEDTEDAVVLLKKISHNSHNAKLKEDKFKEFVKKFDWNYIISKFINLF